MSILLQEEFQLAIFNNRTKENLFANRVLYNIVFFFNKNLFIVYMFFTSFFKIHKFTLYMQIFDLFDVKGKGVIDFGDFVRALNVFHPNTSQEVKIDCKLKIR